MVINNLPEILAIHRLSARQVWQALPVGGPSYTSVRNYCTGRIKSPSLERLGLILRAVRQLTGDATVGPSDLFSLEE